MPDTANWNDNVRSDGARVGKGLSGYIAISPDGDTVHYCLHCGLPFESAETARLVADKLFPQRATA